MKFQKYKRLNGSSDDELNYDEYLEEELWYANYSHWWRKIVKRSNFRRIVRKLLLRSAKMPMYDTLMQMGVGLDIDKGMEIFAGYIQLEMLLNGSFLFL